MTDDTMTLARFAVLARTYGGRLERWPEPWRHAARGVAATPEGQAHLAAAAGLDAMLDRYAPPLPGAALVGRVTAMAGRPLAARRRLRRWLLGLGLVGAGLAGGVAGAVAIMAVSPDPDPRWATPVATVTAFGDVRPDAETAWDLP